MGLTVKHTGQKGSYILSCCNTLNQSLLPATASLHLSYRWLPTYSSVAMLVLPSTGSTLYCPILALPPTGSTLYYWLYPLPWLYPLLALPSTNGSTPLLMP